MCEKLVGFMACGGRVDDNEHEYDKVYDVWYCPTLNEGEDDE